MVSGRPTKRGGEPRVPVLIALTHGVARDSLRGYLDCQTDLRVVGAVADGPSLVRAVAQLRPRVAVVELALKGLSGIVTTRILIERTPDIGVVILTSYATPALVRRAYEAGAGSVLTEESSGEALLLAIREAAAGRPAGRARAAGRVIAAGSRPPRGAHGAEPLTGAERQILRLAADGSTNARIAQTLGLSPRTVETYRLRLMRKLGLEHFAALVKYAVRHGIVELE